MISFKKIVIDKKLIICLFFIFTFFICLKSAQAQGLTPTIHSVAGGGLWNQSSTWVEGRKPSADDIVEINGMVQMTTNEEIAGLVVIQG